jgi:hypothetical protein
MGKDARAAGHCKQTIAIKYTKLGSLYPRRVRSTAEMTGKPHQKAKQLPCRLLALNRGGWSIENRLHWVRDVTFDEDRSQVRKGARAQAMAALRNLAIGLLRRAGARNIAAALRHCGRYVEKALRLIGL